MKAFMGEDTGIVSGVLKEIRFHQNNYLIGVLDRGISIKGNIISPQIGLEYEFQGKWERHLIWGNTFIFSKYKTFYPRDLDAIRSYLIENCKWVGPEISKKLVNAFGEDTLSICKDDPGKVATGIAGISTCRALEISAMLKNNEADENLQIELKSILAGTKVSRRAMMKIVELYGQGAPDLIRKNPYRLIDDIEGIGFLTADMVASKVGFEREGMPRISAGIVYALKESAFSGGHTCLPVNILFLKAKDILMVRDEKIRQAIDEMISEKRLVKIEDCLYLPNLYENEKFISEKLKILLFKRPRKV